MSRSSALVAIFATLATLATLHPTTANTGPAFDPTARSLVRMESLARQLEGGITRQIAERGIASDDAREEIAMSAANSLRRATTCLKRRFFDNAETVELEERLLELDELAERVRATSAKLGLYGHLREKLAAFLNERDWLMRQFGLNRV